jgi:hypothetical protein
MKRFKIKLRRYFTPLGISYYKVSKATGVTQNTARRYLMEDEVMIDRLEPHMFLIAEFFGLGFNDIKEFVEIVESPDPGETKTPLALDEFEPLALVG